MAHPDRLVALDLLVFAPLPFERDGQRTHQLGVSVFYAELLPRLAAAGHRVRVIAEAPTPIAGEERTGLPIEAERLDVDWFAFEYRSGRKPADAAFCQATQDRVAPLFDRAVATRRPDLVVLGREILAPAILPLCQAHGLPTTVIAHGVTLAAASRHDYPAAARAGLYEGLRGVDHVIAVARHLEATLRSHGVERASTLTNAADTERFHPAPRDPGLLDRWSIQPDRLIVAQVASLKAAKRPLDILRAAEHLAGEDLPIVNLIVGDGPGRADLEAEVRRAGLADRFRFAGELEHAQMPDVMRLADIVVLASESEGYPLIFSEAQACGRVVVASDIPAAREALRDGETGVLFRMGDAADLAARLRSLAGSPSLRRRIGEQARAAACAWNTQAVAEAYAQAFGQIAARTNAG
jgi:glycosyltransferase involved in cell wall biosynthesis